MRCFENPRNPPAQVRIQNSSTGSNREFWKLLRPDKENKDNKRQARGQGRQVTKTTMHEKMIGTKQQQSCTNKQTNKNMQSIHSFIQSHAAPTFVSENFVCELFVPKHTSNACKQCLVKVFSYSLPTVERTNEQQTHMERPTRHAPSLRGQ